MITLRSVGNTIRARRIALGLTQERLAALSGISRRTVQGLENCAVADLGFERLNKILSVLGLTFESPVTSAKKGASALRMGANTASVSYKGVLSAEMLEHTLATGAMPPGFEAHVGHFLDEAPVNYVVRAVMEVADHRQAQRPPLPLRKIPTAALHHSAALLRRDDLQAGVRL